MSADSLAATFCAHYSGAAPSDCGALETLLTATISKATKAWPTVALPTDEYVAFLAARAVESDDVCATLESLSTADLYIAFGCVSGSDAAVAALQEKHGGAIDAALVRSVSRVDERQEVKQRVLEYLLLPRPDRPAPLALYAGQGPLRSFLYISALREGIRADKKGKQREHQRDIDMLDAASGDDDPELAILKERCRAHFKSAFRDALGRLGARERTLLRCHYLDGLSTREMGKIYSTHGTTVTRWLAAARSKLLMDMRQQMRRELNMSPSELNSMYRVIASQFELTIGSLLETKSDASA